MNDCVPCHQKTEFSEACRAGWKPWADEMPAPFSYAGLSLVLGGPRSKVGLVLWPASTVLALEVSRRSWAGLSCLEIGPGLGVPSLLAAKAGADVTALDAEDEVLARLRDASKANAAPVRLVQGTFAECGGLYDCVWGSDVMYDAKRAAAVAHLITRVWTGRGPVILVEAQRPKGRAEIGAAFAGRRVKVAVGRGLTWRAEPFEVDVYRLDSFTV